MRRTIILSLGILGLGAPVRAISAQSGDRAAVLAAVHGFHDALSRGDSVAALGWLAPDVRILESGGVETRDEYRRGHLPGDINFARAVPSTRGEPTVTISGDVAWVVSASRTTGTYRDRQVNSAGAELMVLSRGPEGWRIRAIHWSSRAIRNP
jgi:ketosteroid isomerase-like protein